MIAVKCNTVDTITLGELKPFQGDLKKRTTKDVEQLKASLKSEGLLMPFVVWSNNGDNMLLDGHGRLMALTDLALEDKELATYKWPVIYVEADNEIDARKFLLQITSSYGHITKKGVVTFCASIPTYTAPSINRFVGQHQKRPRKEKREQEQILKIRVPVDKIDQVKEILKQVDYIEVL